MVTSLNSLSFPSFSSLAMSSLIKSTCQFLYHTITEIPEKRLHSCAIMTAFKNSNASLEELLGCNHCQLFLRAYNHSEIVDGSDLNVLDDAWLGHSNHNAHQASS